MLYALLYRVGPITNVDQMDMRRIRFPRLIAWTPLTSSTKPVGRTPSSFHLRNVSRPASRPIAKTSENRLKPPSVSNC